MAPSLLRGCAFKFLIKKFWSKNYGNGTVPKVLDSKTFGGWTMSQWRQQLTKENKIATCFKRFGVLLLDRTKTAIQTYTKQYRKNRKVQKVTPAPKVQKVTPLLSRALKKWASASIHALKHPKVQKVTRLLSIRALGAPRLLLNHELSKSDTIINETRSRMMIDFHDFSLFWGWSTCSYST